MGQPNTTVEILKLYSEYFNVPCTINAMHLPSTVHWYCVHCTCTGFTIERFITMNCKHQEPTVEVLNLNIE